MPTGLLNPKAPWILSWYFLPIINAEGTFHSHTQWNWDCTSKFKFTYHNINVRYIESDTGEEVRHGKDDEDRIFEERKVQHLSKSVPGLPGARHAAAHLDAVPVMLGHRRRQVDVPVADALASVHQLLLFGTIHVLGGSGGITRAFKSLRLSCASGVREGVREGGGGGGLSTGRSSCNCLNVCRGFIITKNMTEKYWNVERGCIFDNIHAVVEINHKWL